jgi:phosphoribosylformylglycinamidine (FGAM) synthase-like amidotransferase family enzyme
VSSTPRWACRLGMKGVDPIAPVGLKAVLTSGLFALGAVVDGGVVLAQLAHAVVRKEVREVVIELGGDEV